MKRLVFNFQNKIDVHKGYAYQISKHGCLQKYNLTFFAKQANG
jgi:hypothetical protein